ncbi:MAG: Uma2 family endonuclease, partial [Deltaproteobacteria bacterium]|nr:Uma2 family endonuclease [Deltaproteobacteria bacterium]
MDVELDGVGSWTIKDRRRQAAAEPDECYLVGHRTPAKRPDIAIEVHWTSGGISKLAIWDRLAVPEVWVWKDDALTVYRRQQRGGYSPCKRSRFLPTLDLGLLAQFIEVPNQLVAVKAYRTALRRH